MRISHGHAAGTATTEVSETFTGTVLRDPVLSGDGAPTVNSVTFPRGAGSDTVMTHIAISLGVTDWGDPVSDEDYLV